MNLHRSFTSQGSHDVEPFLSIDLTQFLIQKSIQKMNR